MSSVTSLHILLATALLTSALLVSGCSSSGDSPSPAAAESDGIDGVNLPVDDGPTDDSTGETVDGAGEVVPDPPVQNVTRVNFDVTVPVYVSNALQVRLAWGNKEIAAMWVTDELWTASDEFPANTEHLLSVNFYDRNGGITLASFETTFTTGSATSQTYHITADQFDTDLWDDDADGISNLAELIAGTDPEQNDPALEPAETLLPVSASVELHADKTFRIRWERSSAADYYRVLENPDGVSGYTAISGELDASTDYFDHRVALHMRMNARYIVEACNAGGCTSSVQQLIEGSLVEAIGYLKASNTGPDDEFGSSISLSADGSVLAVGAPSEDSAAIDANGNQDDDSQVRSGAVYVFLFDNGRWQQQAYLKASNTEAYDNFGYETSLSADGNTLAVGAPGEQSAATGVNGDQNDNSATESGAVYVFTRSGENWQQQAYLKASNTQTQAPYGSEEFYGSGEFFGQAISLSTDGNTMVVGATGEDSAALGVNGNQNDNSAVDAGAVYVFVRNNGIWQQQAYLKAAVDRSNRFGRSVSLNADGNTLAVGVYDPTVESGTGNTTRGPHFSDFYGAVYVFVRTDATWDQQAFLTAGSGSPEEFGRKINLTADGNTLAISAKEAAYVFELINSGWQQQAFLEASNPNLEGPDRFGWSMSLSADGNTLAVGAEEEDSAASGLDGYQGDEISKENSGATYVFIRNSGVWQQQAYVKASNSQSHMYFGTDLSLSADGGTLAISANWEQSKTTGPNGDQDDQTFLRAGAVYLY